MDALSSRDPLVLGRFRLLGRLGAGGMGRVYLGRGPSGELAAVKMMHTRIADDPGFRDRFAREVTIARALDMPSVARVVDADPDAALPWLAMEYLAAPSLEHAVARIGPLDESSLGVLAWRLAEACADLHARNVTHRDLKPSNVMLAEDRPKLIDFGIARAVDGTAITQTGLTLGPPGFMSPEQALGDEPGPASDVFSLAAVLVYAATGCGPFGQASNAVAMLRRVVDDEPDLSGVVGWLRPLLEPCFAKDPGARPTAAGLADLLARHGDGPWPPAATLSLLDQAATVDPVPPPTVTGTKTRRQVLLAGLGIGIGWLGVGGVTIAAVRSGYTLPADRPTNVDDDDWTTIWTIDTPLPICTFLVTDGGLYAALPFRLYAIDPETGRERWHVQLDQAGDAAPTVAVDTRLSHVYVGVPGRLSAHGSIDGRMVWNRTFDPSEGRSRSTAVSGDMVITAAPGLLTAADRTTGQVLAAHSMPGGDVGALRTFGERSALVAGSQLRAFDVVSGQLLWQHAIASRDDARIELSVAGGIAVALAGADLTAVDTRSGALAWRSKAGGAGPAATASGRLLVSGETVLVLGADGRVHASNLRSGAPLWAHPIVRGPDLTSMATDGTTVFASGTEPGVIAIDLSSGVRGDTAGFAADLLGARGDTVYTARNSRRYGYGIAAVRLKWA
jgi:serine/threonine protein kinase/outer membrane protein assembly factor BamB